MWSYYGSKSKIVKHYSAPKFDSIYEPFGGTARYSLLYWWIPNIVVGDSYKVVMDIWRFLQKANAKDILDTPDVENGENIEKYRSLLAPELYSLMGFCINNGSAVPKHTAGTGNFNSWNRDKHNIAKNLFKIRHWTFVDWDYREFLNIEGTWFIDPPYQKRGHHYRNNHIDYVELAKWCRNRAGQVIVCENEGADWLSFRPLVEMHGQLRKSKEVIWTNSD